ncbi:hypothetical protein PPYR_10804 [Photinus pyralis]|uniref:Ig-like domain-containing protein n=3 Tax=Photinus pyralis TaxID=7054 RepID=A0A5N4AHG4_PHOPY|nr:uncharacterized protein LOC116172955 [Photinus pyralis]KAB0796743.1 hypothetical protein PPYR_10804 [Photinus pyralis]
MIPSTRTNLNVLLLLLGFCSESFLSTCPSTCECKWKSGKESAICTNANLSSVPLHLHPNTQLLNLTSNNLITIKHDEFSKAGLLNLQKIYISKCRLKVLDRYAFRNLINLVQLDLSYNQLSVIPSHVFESISELRELKLSGNPIQRILNDAFVHVPQLVKLELSECKIGTIEENAFSGLEKSLEWLKLDKNKLSDVKSSSFTILQSLHELDIAGNPWNCTCKLRPLREWMLRQNVPFAVPPVCRFPSRLGSRSWDKLELDEFACVPEIIALDPKAHGIEGKNVTLTCNIAGIPEPNVRWLLKNKVIGNLSATHFSSGKKLYVVQLQNSSSDLTILTADLQDAGVYVCAAENKAGRSEASVTLAVSRKPPESLLSKKVLFASVVVGLLFVLVASSIALCICAIRKKQVMQWRDRNCRREDNYEKIEMNHKIVSNVCAKSETAQSELMQVNNPRRNGDYRLVPGAETEQENDRDDEGFDGSVGVAAISKNQSDETRTWTKQLSNDRWNSPELPLLDTDDLHIPRRTIKENRDDRKRSSHSTSGTYNRDRMPPSNVTSPQSTQLPFAKKQKTGNCFALSYASSTSTEFSGFVEDDPDKKYPDLIEGSPSTHKGSLKAISEGNSVTDISEFYCTLPRKGTKDREQWKYSSTDSQFPLLNESRYSSSGGESNCSQPSAKRRMSDITKSVHKVNQRSNSFLNLSSTKQSSPPSPIHETPNSTPLLDINALDNRVSYRRHIVTPSPSPVPTTIANSYDYHAAQLERFLEEYRTLQKELTKMKETCENISKEKTSSRYLDPALGNTSSPISPISDTSNSKYNSSQNSLLTHSPNSNQTLDNSLINFESELSKYILQRNSSPKTFNSEVFNNMNGQ